MTLANSDQATRFLLPELGIRGVAVHLGQTWQAIAERAAYPAAAAELLGEAARRHPAEHGADRGLGRTPRRPRRGPQGPRRQEARAGPCRRGQRAATDQELPDGQRQPAEAGADHDGAMAGGATGMSEEAVRASSEYTWALQHAEIYTLGWVALILAVFVPLSIRQYQRAVAR